VDGFELPIYQITQLPKSLQAASFLFSWPTSISGSIGSESIPYKDFRLSDGSSLRCDLPALLVVSRWFRSWLRPLRGPPQDYPASPLWHWALMLIALKVLTNPDTFSLRVVMPVLCSVAE